MATGGAPSGWRGWWAAPSTLRVLTGDERSAYSEALFRSFRAFCLPAALAVIGAGLLLPLGSELHLASLVVAVGLIAIAAAGRPLVGSDAGVNALVLPVAGILGIGAGAYADGYGEAIAFTTLCVAVVSVWVPPRWAAAAVAIGCSTLLVGLLVNHDLDHPVARWAAVAVVEVSTFLAMVAMLARVHVQAAQLAELNRTLEDRVDAQVAEIEGLGRLRRFLSPQVADAVLAGGGADAEVLAPHRRRIAVVFCDLRGFTGFSNSSEPEEVLEVLDGYYQVVGTALRAHGATVGSFQGDGVLAYFGDPVPIEDPAGTAVRMALELRAPLGELCARWNRRGYDLGWGMGIAFGFATLGTVGFEGRSDYTPLGAVVNLASRLSDEAARGEILLDGRTQEAVADEVVTVERRVQLRGFALPVPAHAVVAPN